MKILVISDIHGSLKYTDLALKAFVDHQADQILALGDFLYHGPRNPLTENYSPAEVLVKLNKVKDKIIAVRGNCDSEVDQMVLEFDMFRDHQTFKLGDRTVYATHGHVASPDNLPNLEKGSIFISGHIHLPVAIEKEGIFILNPGSISLPKENNPNSYGILTEDGFTIYDFDSNILKTIIFN